MVYKFKGKNLAVFKRGDNHPLLLRSFSKAGTFEVMLPEGNYIFKGENILIGSEKRGKYMFPVERMPAPEKRTLQKKYRVVYVPSNPSPASINVNRGVIIYNEYFTNLPYVFQDFILAHELGHRYFNTEKYCDLFACRELLKKGYGKHVALYCLRKTLKNRQTREERYNYVLGKIKDL